MDPVAAEGGNIEAPCIGQRLDDRAEERKRDKKKKEKGELNELSKAASLPPPSPSPSLRSRGGGGSCLQRRDVRPAVFPLAASLVQCNSNSSDFAGGGFSASRS